MKMQIVNPYLGLDRSWISALDSCSSLVIAAKTRGHINHSTGLCLFSPSTVHGWPVTDTRQAADRVASWYCQRRESFSADGIVSGGKQTMAVMFRAIGDDFWDALACDQTTDVPSWGLPLVSMETSIKTCINQKRLQVTCRVITRAMLANAQELSGPADFYCVVVALWKLPNSRGSLEFLVQHKDGGIF